MAAAPYSMFTDMFIKQDRLQEITFIFVRFENL
jgi:hypothetical protein